MLSHMALHLQMLVLHKTCVNANTQLCMTKNSHLLHHNVENFTEQSMCVEKITFVHQTHTLENEIGSMLGVYANKAR